VSNTRLNIVLFQPEIPQNTGNIGRTCVALGAKLWLVRPFGFQLDETRLRRAGLDYWEHLEWEAVDDWHHLATRLDLTKAWLFSKFATQSYTSACFESDCTLVFGSESKGLPESVREAHAARLLSIPMPGPVRSLNLSVAVGIGAYEAYRQMNIRVENRTS
jgi:tRNA (cytidine/uridine-2'-O-)-methyltransferase